jgi:AcrR family transcriptional regulator
VATKTRDRMLLSAVQLFRRHGYNGTGFREVVAHSGTPRGSIYHHFQGGKAQLGVETLAFAGEFANASMARFLQTDDVVVGLEKFWASWVRIVESSDFHDGCPIVGVAAESHPEAPELAAAAASVFEQWEATFAAAFRKAGVRKRQEARDLANLVISTLEGATLISRAARDTNPLVRAGKQVARAVRAALP